MIDVEDLPDRVTIVHRPEPGSDDSYGNSTIDWSSASRDEDVPASFQADPSSEDVTDTDRVTERVRLYLLPVQTIGALDQVEFAGNTYEVVGAPQRLRLDGAEHHVKAQLTRITA